MSEHLYSQSSALVIGVNTFAPLVDKMHSDFDAERFVDWPTLILTTTMQATAISLFKLLPPENAAEILDRRSLATLVRNLVDTHDVIEMMVNSKSAEEHHLNRQILGLYISSRIAHVQKSVCPTEAEKFYPLAKETYWKKIEESPLYDKGAMSRLKSGESIFYKTRKERLRIACGEHSDFVGGVLADLSTYVHSIPPALWMGKSHDICADTPKNRDMIAVWIRLANFFYARSIGIVLKAAGYEFSDDLKAFHSHHQEVFS